MDASLHPWLYDLELNLAVPHCGPGFNGESSVEACTGCVPTLAVTPWSPWVREEECVYTHTHTF